MLKDFRVDKGALKGHPHVVAKTAAGRVLPLALDVEVADRAPGLEDAVDFFHRDEVLEDGEAVDPPFLHELVDVVVVRAVHKAPFIFTFWQ